MHITANGINNATFADVLRAFIYLLYGQRGPRVHVGNVRGTETFPLNDVCTCA